MKSRSLSKSPGWFSVTLLQAIEMVRTEMKRLGIDPSRTASAVYAAPSRRVAGAAYAVFIKGREDACSPGRFLVHRDGRVEFSTATKAC